MSNSKHEALRQMKLTILANLCIDEIKQCGCHETADGRYSVELLRRATVEQMDQLGRCCSIALAKPSELGYAATLAVMWHCLVTRKRT